MAMVAEDIEDQTRDFIIKRLAQVLKGHPLSEFVAHLLQTMGYRTRVTPLGPDHGIDIIAHKRKAIPGEVSVERGSEHRLTSPVRRCYVLFTRCRHTRDSRMLP